MVRPLTLRDLVAAVVRLAVAEEIHAHKLTRGELFGFLLGHEMLLATGALCSVFALSGLFILDHVAEVAVTGAMRTRRVIELHLSLSLMVLLNNFDRPFLLVPPAAQWLECL